MLTRLMAYQCKETADVQAACRRVNKRIYFIIDLPSMILAVAFGISLLILKDINWKAPWLHMKLMFAFFLIVCDIICGRLVVGKGFKKPFYYHIFHGLTGIFFIAVLIAIYILKAKA